MTINKAGGEHLQDVLFQQINGGMLEQEVQVI
jgi:hypothetical protein